MQSRLNENAISQLRVSFDNFTGQFVTFLHFCPDILKRIGWECASHGPAGQTMLGAALPCSHNCEGNSLSSALRSQEKCLRAPFQFPSSLLQQLVGWTVPGRGQSFCVLTPILLVSGGLFQPFPRFCDSCSAGMTRAKGDAVFGGKKEIPSKPEHQRRLQVFISHCRQLSSSFFFSFGEGFGIWGCLIWLPLPICNRQEFSALL